RALTNLVENAIRHAPNGSSVTLKAAAQEGGVDLRVGDAGSGVPTELRERIFDPFVQLDAGNPTLSRSGRGLGLAFCKLVASAHGGRIWIEDNSPGALLCMWLPQ